MTNAYFKITNATSSNQKIKEKAKLIQVDRGVLQGCALALCMFILCMDVISKSLNKLPELKLGLDLEKTAIDELIVKLNNKLGNPPMNDTLQQQQPVIQNDDENLDNRRRLSKVNHLSFVDDVKMFANCKEDFKRMKDTFVKVGTEMGLKINLSKCGVIPSILETVSDITDVEQLNTAYKYIGLPEKRQRIDLKYLKETLSNKIIGKVAKIFQSCLSTGQKIKLCNISIVHVIQYIVMHAAGSVSMRKIIALCKILDKCIVKVLSGSIKDNEVINLRQPTQTLARLYLKSENGGLGLINLAEAAKKSIITYDLNMLLDPIHKKVKCYFLKQSIDKKMSLISLFHTLMKQTKITYTIEPNSLLVNEVCFINVKEAKKAIEQSINERFQIDMFEK